MCRLKQVIFRSGLLGNGQHFLIAYRVYSYCSRAVFRDGFLRVVQIHGNIEGLPNIMRHVSSP